jgi:L-iditol 2-dehydrogenase
MLQQVLVNPGEIRFDEVAVPEVKGNEVLLKVIEVGICGSDIHAYHGKHPFISCPVVQGHEVAGEIVKTGADVKDYKIGDRVTIQPQITCGTCYQCRSGRYNICDTLKVMGCGAIGSASTFFAVEEKLLTRLPDGMSFDEGAMIEPLAVAVHAVKRGEDVKGKNVIVLGAGPIGNLVAQSAKSLGAKKVMITDVSEFRLQKAAECGTDICVNVLTQDLDKEILKEFGPDRADKVFDCAGNDKSIHQAITCARKGTQIIIVAVFPAMSSVELCIVQDRELELIGTLMYIKEDYDEAVELVSANKVALKPLVSNRFPFEQYPDAYKFIDANGDKAMKVLIDVQK